MNSSDEMQNAGQKFNMGFLWLICIVAAMGGLLFGYDWVVVGGAKAFYEPHFNITMDMDLMRGWAMSSALFGCIFGAIMSGMLTDRFGRKRLLILAGLMFTVSAVMTSLSWSFASYNVARIIGGLGIGLASNLSPMFIAEVSPAKMRGKFVSINQLTIVIGVLMAQVINMCIAQPVPTADQVRLIMNPSSAYGVLENDPEIDFEKEQQRASKIADAKGLASVMEKFPELTYVPEPTTPEGIKAKKLLDNEVISAYILPTWNGRVGWRWMFGAETVPAFLFFLLMFFVPESPRWLIKYGRKEEAEAILTRIGGSEYGKSELANIQQTISNEEVARVNYKDLLESKLFKILMLGMFLAVFQQWCGINVIFNYAQEVFSAAGHEVNDMMFYIVITGIVNLVFTFIAIYTVDKIGRRPLMLFGAAGLAVIYVILGACYMLESTGIHMLILIVSAIACYSMTLAPVTWVIISEIFPNRIRGAAMSVAVLSLWIACTVLALAFPYMNRKLGAHGAFWVFGAISVIGFLGILFKLPETKGRSLEKIERELVD